MATPVKVGIIGCGSRVRHIAKNLEDASDGRVEITALADPSEISIKDTCKLFGRDLRVESDYNALCEADDIDWIMIGSWNCQHKDHAIKAMTSGKHIFCEKPLATTLDDCLAMRECRDKTGQKMYMGFTLRHSPHYRQINDILSSGELGQIISFEFNETLDFNHGGFIHSDWRRLTKNSGTHILEKCCHDIDLAIWMIGSVPLKIACFGGLDFFKPENVGQMQRVGKNSDGVEAFKLWRNTTGVSDPFTCEKDILDNQVAIIQFANGVRATFHSNAMAGIPERRMYILASEGALRADVLTGKIETRPVAWNAATTLYDNPGGGHGGGDTIMVRELAAAMCDDAEIKATLENGLLSAITCYAIDQATESGEVIDLTEMWQKAGVEIK